MTNPAARSLPRRQGFTLVVTLSLMTLLTVIAIGLLSLSSIALRSSSRTNLMKQAQANARLAMIIAVGEIQKDLGPDRSAAAPASMVLDSPSQPHATGVWESWAFDPTSGDKPPDFNGAKKDLFKGWLMSVGGQPGRLDPTLPDDGPDNPVLLLGTGSVAASGLQSTEVHGGLISIDSGSAAGQGFAWAALQEDTKAHVQPGRGDEPDSDEDLFCSWFAPDESGLAGLDFVGDLADNRNNRQRSLTTATLSLAGGAKSISRESFHHLTTCSRGVLADANHGGLRRDLTADFEDFDDSPLAGQRVYDANTGSEPWWDHLADYYGLAERVKNEADGGNSPLDIEEDLKPLTEISRANTAPKRTVLTPVMAKMDIIFSMVTHDLRPAAQSKYARADPGQRHYSPWLVFEPIVTLWNPYNVPIKFSELKMYFDKVPVGLRFKKLSGRSWVDVRNTNNDTTDYWWPLSRFIWGGGKEDAISEFFVRLRGGSADTRPGGDITLNPGETRVFTAHVSASETWGRVKSKFTITNRANARDTIQNSGRGVDYTGGWNRTGGFRFDHLARFQDHRNTSSLYSFERTMNNRNDWHWVALRGSDRFRARLRLMDNDNPDNDDSADNDRNRSFNMRLSLMSSQAGGMTDTRNIVQDMTISVQDYFKLYATDEPKIIEHDIVAEEVYQSDNDRGPGGKSPFAVLSLTAKPTRDLLHPTKGWLFGNPATANLIVNERQATYAAQSYELSCLEVFGSNTFPMVDVDVATGTRGFFGPGHTSQYGLTAATMFVLPREPMISIGQFHAANLLTSAVLPHFNYPLGNSHAHPLIPPDEVRENTLLDHSYALNWALWDSYYFSSLSRHADVTASEFAAGAVPLNRRMIFHTPAGGGRQEAIERITSGSIAERGRRIASHQLLQGPFNVNSSSIEAWKAVLSGLRDRAAQTRDGSERTSDEKTPFARALPAITAADEVASIGGGAGTGGQESARAARWVGIHLLDDEQIAGLAREIVKQVKKRGQEDGAPILTLGEFANRRPGSARSLHAQAGLLQTAIDEAQGSQALYSLEDGDAVILREAVPNDGALVGNTAEGSPAHLLQGDILQEIGSILTTHTDTLRIRCYGRAGSGPDMAEAWCEAIVQRVPDYVDQSDSAEALPAAGSVNHRFGRRYQVVSFRWLSRSEV